jgi:L-iditol 2-dehydrogenase
MTGSGGTPRRIGHEWTGEVVALAVEDPGLSVGDRVAVDWRVICGVCHYCRRGAFNFCLAAEPPRVRGGYGEYGCAPVSNLRRLPSHVTYAEAVFAEPLACCINGMRRSNVDFGRSVVVIGCGPIGLMHLQLARHRGAHVIACDLLPERLEKAREVGAHETVCPAQEDAVARVKEATGGFGADAMMIAVGGVAPLEMALQMADLNATVNLFAGTYPAETIALDPNLIHYKQINLTGSHDFSPDDFSAALRLIADGIVNTRALISHTLPLDRVQEAFEIVAAREGVKVVVEC